MHKHRANWIRTEQRADNLRAARICAVLANLHRTDGKAWTEEDFMPREVTPAAAESAEPIRIQPVEEQVAMAKAFVAAFAGRKRSNRGR